MEPTIKKVQVATYLSRAYCPDCEAELERSDIVLSTYPAQYQYFCPQCGYGYTTTNCYPGIEYEEIEDEEDNKK